MVNAVTNLLKSATSLTGSSLTETKPANMPSFSSMLTNAVKGVADNQRAAEAATMQVAAGEQVPMHEVINMVSKAEITLQTMLTVRDKAVEAYQEIQRMPI